MRIYFLDSDWHISFLFLLDPKKILEKLVPVLKAGGRVNGWTYVMRPSPNAVGAVTEFHKTSGSVVTSRVGVINYPNQVTGLKKFLGKRLPPRMSVQHRYVLSESTEPNSKNVRLRTSKTFTVIKFIIANKRQETGIVFFLLKKKGALRLSNCTDQCLRVLRDANYETRQNEVCSTSSVRQRVPRKIYTTLSKLRTNLLQIPAWRDSLVGLNLHFCIFFELAVDNLSLFNTFPEFFLLFNERGAFFRPNHGKCNHTWHKTLNSH